MKDSTLSQVNEGFESFYERQVGQLKGEDWAASLRDELLKLGLVYISQSRQEGGGRAKHQIIKIRCTDMQTQMSISKMGEEIFICTLVFEEREKERIIHIIYITYSCQSNDRNGVAWSRLEIWKSRNLGVGKVPFV